MSKLLKGWFRQFSSEDRPDFLCVNGDEYSRVDISTDPDVPLETFMEVELHEGKLLRWTRDPAVVNDFEPTRVDIACAFITRVGEEPTASEIEDHLSDCAGLQNEIRRLSAGRWSVQVTPYFFQSDSSFTLNGFDYRSLRVHIDTINPDNRHNCWGASGGWSTAYCGRARLSGWYFWAYPNCGLGTKVHEFFHTKGLHHAGTPNSEYGERKVWMGNSRFRDTLNAPQMHRINLLDQEYVKILDRAEGAEVNLQVADTYPLAMLEDSHKLVICKTGNDTTKRVAVSYNDGTVDVHIPAYDRSIVFAKTTLLASLKNEGDGYMRAGVRVERGPTTHNGNSVHVKITNDTDQTELVEPPAFVSSAESYPLSDDLNGIWRNPDWTGQGVHFRYLNNRNQVFVAWLTWDNDRNQEWYWTVADIDGTVATGTLHTLDNNQALVDAGTCAIRFYDRDSGTFLASLTDKGIHALPLSRLAESIPSSYNGYWGMGDNTGLSLQAVPPTVTFDYPRAVGYYLQNDGRWSLVSGPFGEDLTIYSITGGGRGIAADVSIKATGTLSHDRIQSGIALA